MAGEGGGRTIDSFLASLPSIIQDNPSMDMEMEANKSIHPY